MPEEPQPDQSIQDVLPTPQRRRSYAKEIIFLAEQASETGIRVLPGQNWAVHYPENGSRREAAMAALRRGGNPAELASELRPDALIFNINDLETEGLEAVSNRIRQMTARISYYDYLSLAENIAKTEETGVEPQLVGQIHDRLTQSRTERRLLSAYGQTGRRQLEGALRSEARNLSQKTDPNLMDALRLSWLVGDARLSDRASLEKLLSNLQSQDRDRYDQLQSLYRQYSEAGQQDQLDELMANFIQQQGQSSEQEKGETSEQLRQELEPFMDKVSPPGTPGDPAISLADQDEYHTPPPNSPESREKMPNTPFFEIRPSGESRAPLAGHYVSGRKSYYDVERKTWSKRKEVSAYYSPVSSQHRQSISRSFPGALESVPIPTGYALDSSSLRFRGAEPRILRDQNGCFYIESDGLTQFEIDFAPEDQPFVSRPVPQDSELIHRGVFSSETQEFLDGLSGTAAERAVQIAGFIKSHHYYPGGGNLEMAQALQYKLRSESTGQDYIQNLESSEFLECYSTATLFAAMSRAAGIPTRLVNGHLIRGAKDGKTVIDATTGHAWNEIWDGQKWIRIDATPGPKPGEKNEQEEEKMDGETEEAIGDSLEAPGSRQGENQPESADGQLGQATDQDISEGEKNLEQAQKESSEIDQRSSEINQKLNQAKNFSDLEKVADELQSDQLLDDEDKDQLKNRLNQKKEALKDGIRDELDKLVEDGFMEESERDKLLKELEEKGARELDTTLQEIERENALHSQYEQIRDEVMPHVDKWFEYFLSRLPKKQEPEFDEDSLSRRGSFDRRSVNRARNLIFGTVRNPQVMSESIEPRFIASILVDVSGSMSGPKLENARRLLIFYNEIFSRLENRFGYIRFAISTFSDGIAEIKTFDQSYDSSERYDYSDRTRTTVKARLMQSIRPAGGTNMLPAIQKAAGELSSELERYPDHATGFYFFGDGGDTSGNAERIREFLSLEDREKGFGEHMCSAVMIGDENQRHELANIFGDENTTVAPDLEALIDESMSKFDRDISDYLTTRVE